ncbi:hypothetical protein, partial [Streptomyces anulatus]|uniref:hypothetical protein n=1 Tax=Streptomyces anulatus TaxID=1892 RepID=UPI003448E20E
VITYRPRWSVAFFSGVLGAIVITVVYGVLATVAGLPGNVTVVLVAVVDAVYLSYVALRVRRRSLTVTEDGVVARRDAFTVTVSGADYAGVRSRRVGGLYPVDVMTFDKGAVEPVGLKGRVTKEVPAKVHEIGADRRIQVGVRPGLAQRADRRAGDPPDRIESVTRQTG